MASSSQIQGSEGLPILELWNGASYDAVAQIKKIDPRVPATAAGKTTHNGISNNRHSHLPTWVDGGNIGFTANYLEATKDQLDAQIGDGQLHQWRLTWTDPEGTLTSPNIVFQGFITSGARINMPSEDAWALKFAIKISGQPVFSGSTSGTAPSYVDNFVDTDSTLITAHLADTGQSYSLINSDPTPFIQGNKLYCATGRNTPVLINDTFGSAQDGIFEEAYEQAGATSFPFGFVVFRTPGDLLTYTRVYLFKTSWTIFFSRLVGGVSMWGDSVVVPSMADGAHTVKIQFVGGNITVTLDAGEASEYSVTKTDPSPTYDGSKIYFSARQLSFGGIDYAKFTAL